MSKKLLIVLTVAGMLMATNVFAHWGVDTWNFSDGAYSAGLGLANSSLTSAVSGTILNPDGKGDVLIFNYFDVRNVAGKTQETLFAIINETLKTTEGGVAAKLRFREWDKSFEVFDCDIWLSDNDVWIGRLVRNTANGLTRIYSPDWVIVGGSSGSFTVETTLLSGFDFFTTKCPDPPVGSLTKADLTNMGYFEVIGEERTATKASTTKTEVRADGTYKWGNVVRTWYGTALVDCPNTLAGYAYVVRVTDGVAMGYNAQAVANFVKRAVSLYYGPGFDNPILSQGDEGLDSLEFMLSKANISHGYSIEDIIFGKFSMVVTFPTKHFHFNSVYDTTQKGYMLKPAPYAAPFTGTHSNYGEEVIIRIYDREENLYKPEAGWWSPRTTPKIVLPTEVTILGLYKGTPPTLPAPDQRDTIGFTTGGFQTGWIWVDLANFVTDYDTAAGATHIGRPYSLWQNLVAPFNYYFHFLDFLFSGYYGLPALGLVIQEATNSAVGGAYGEMFPVFFETGWIGPGVWN